MIGETIYKLRKQKGFTLTELAEKANISKSYLSSIERNLNKNPSIQVIKKITRVLQVKPSVLINSKVAVVEPLVEEEWIKLVHELKDTGLEITDIRDNMVLFEFIKWLRESK